MKWNRLPMVGLVSVLCCLPTLSEEPGSVPPSKKIGEQAKVEKVEEVTVHSTPILAENHVDRYGTQVGIVTQKQIEALAAQDLASAVRRVPGVVISRYNPIGSYGGADGGTLFLRGMGTGRPGAEISTLTDGIPRFVGVWTHPLLDHLSIDNLDRIEIFRAPQPVVLGNMAFGAVNLVSRHPVEAGSRGRLELAGGSFATRIGRAEYATRNNRFDLAVSGSSRRSDGHREGADGRVRSLSGQFGYRLAEGWSLALTIDRTDGRASDPGRVDRRQPAIRPYFDSEDSFALLTINHRTDHSEGTLKLYYDDGKINWRQWNEGASPAQRYAFFTDTDWNNYGLKAEERWALGHSGEIRTGFDLDFYGGDSVETRPTSSKTFFTPAFRNRAAWVLASRTFTGRWSATPAIGLRFNQSRHFGSDWAGQAGLVLEQAASGKFHVNLSRGYNLPGVWAAVMFGNFGRPGEFNRLRPEQVENLEFGWSRGFGPNAQLDLTLFRARVKDGLRFVPPPPRPSFQNIGRYDVKGLEIALALKPAPGFELFLGGTATSADPTNTPETPRRTGSLGLHWTPASRWTIDMDAQHLGEYTALNPRYADPAVIPNPERAGGFTLVNSRIAWRPAFAPSEGKLTLFLAGENLTNRDYFYRPGYPMPGRNFCAGITWEF